MAGRRSIATYAKAIGIIAKGPVTARQLSRAVGFSIQSAYAWLRVLKAEKLIHRSGWTKVVHSKNGGAVWEWGDGIDVPYVKMTGAERSRKWRQKRRSLDGCWPVFKGEVPSKWKRI
jgi:hypothetical protein